MINDVEAILYYLDADELPMADAGKRLGYDGFLIWENDDWADPSSVFVWNVQTLQPNPIQLPAHRQDPAHAAGNQEANA